MIELEVEPWTVTTQPNCMKSPDGETDTSGSTTPGTFAFCRIRMPRKPIDLKQLVDRLQLRGIDLPILIRFAGILKHRLGEIHGAFQNAIAEHKYQGQLLLRLSDQGEPAAAGGRRGGRVRQAVQVRPGMRQQAGAAGRRGDGRQRHADHLQRLQGCRVHRNGDAGPKDRPAHYSRSSKNTPSWG